MKNIFLALNLCFVFLFVHGERINIYNYEGEISYNKVLDFTVNLTALSNSTTSYMIKHSYLSVIANVTSDVDCTTKASSSSCGQAMLVYGKLNDPPRPVDFHYDKKDDKGIVNQRNIIFGFEYSPCQISTQDILYIKLVGVEGKFNFTLSINFNYLDKYKVFCPGGVEPTKASYPAASHTKIGTIRHGGKLSDLTMEANMYLLDDQANWKILDIPEKSDKPSPRYGHLLQEFENFLILFGGQDAKGNYLNDLWLLDLDNLEWINIEYQIATKVPTPKFLPSGGMASSHGLLIVYGSKNNFDDTSVNFLDLKILIELVTLKRGSESIKDSELYAHQLNHLWRIVEVKDLLPRYGLTITQIGDDEIMFYGGFDRSDYPVSRLEILRLTDYKVTTLAPNVPSDFPLPRGFHQVLRYGSILILYGGKVASGDNLNDMWKFIIKTKKWVRIKDESNKKELHLYKSNFIFTYLNNYTTGERPLIYGGVNRNKEDTNDLIFLDFPVCQSDMQILGETQCIPCREGYEFEKNKCVACYPGTYLYADSEFYFPAKCVSCPSGTANDKFGMTGINSCRICPYQTYNDKLGQQRCTECPSGEVCLPGSTHSIKNDFLYFNVESPFLADFNYPDFVDKNTKIKKVSKTSALILVSVIMTTVLLFLFIYYKLRRNKIIKFLICMDFRPLTGGLQQKCSGGLITVIYTILIISLSFSFAMRYIYFNEIIEVNNLNHSKEQEALKSSINLVVEIFGNVNCISKSPEYENQLKCSEDFEFYKNSIAKENTLDNLTCVKVGDDICKVNFKCENCKMNQDEDVLIMKIKDTNSFVQLYHWQFENVWAENFDRNRGYSVIQGIYKPDSEIASNCVFKGNEPSTINISLTPIFFTDINTNTMKSGYKASLGSYERGSIKNELNFFQTSDTGVSLQIRFSYTSNSYQVTSKNQLELMDFFAFVLGMLAGFSFLSRIGKYICEKCKIFDYSLEDYEELQEEGDKKENLNESESKKPQKDLEMSNGNSQNNLNKNN